jgi:hypothetical protein
MAAGFAALVVMSAALAGLVDAHATAVSAASLMSASEITSAKLWIQY